MDRAARAQNTYDHRLKNLVRKTGDIELAVRNGVSRSTARGWLSTTQEPVVTLDVFDASRSELEREIVRLRQRNQILATLLRVIVVAMNLSEFSLSGTRLPESRKKSQLPRVIDRSRSRLPLRTVLCLLRISPARYYAWKRAEKPCDLDGSRAYLHALIDNFSRRIRAWRLSDLPCSADFAAGRGRLLQLLRVSLSPCRRYHPVGAERRVSQISTLHAVFANELKA